MSLCVLVFCNTDIAAAQTCTFSVSPSSVTAGVHGLPDPTDPRAGSVQPPRVNVTASKTDCGWTASTTASWIQLLTSSGTGSGYVQYKVTGNNTGTPRTGTIQVAGKTITVKQDAQATKGAGAGTTKSNCKAAISPSSTTVESRGSSGQFKVKTGDDCPWTAQTRTPWIDITSGASSKGGGTVQYTVGENKGAKRTGTITVAGKAFRINQKEAPQNKREKTLQGNTKKPVVKGSR